MGDAARERSAKAEEEADESIKEHTGIDSSGEADLDDSRRTCTGPNYIAMRRENPTSALSEVHAEPMKRTASRGKKRGGGGNGMIRQASAGEVKTPPGRAIARRTSGATEHRGLVRAARMPRLNNGAVRGWTPMIRSRSRSSRSALARLIPMAGQDVGLTWRFKKRIL